MLHTTVLGTDAEFDAIQQEWDGLLESSDQRVFFLRWHWNRTWWRFYAPPGSRLLIVACRDSGGRLVGLAPLCVQTRRYFGFLPIREVCFLGTGAVRMSEYLDVIARRGSEGEVGRAVAACLYGQPGWDRLWLWSVPAESTMLRHLREALGLRASQRISDRAYVIDTSGDWASTTRGFRHDVDRALRQVFSDEHSRIVRVQTLDELQPALEDLVRLHQARWQAKGQPGSFAQSSFEAFLREVARDCLERGRLGFWRLVIDGRAAAALIAFVDFETAHYFQSGFDPESPHSLGQVIVGLAIRDCVTAPGVRRFDLMGGEAGYKSEWTAAYRETVELEYLPAGLRSGLFVPLRALRERLARVRRVYRARAKRRRTGLDVR